MISWILGTAEVGLVRWPGWETETAVCLSSEEPDPAGRLARDWVESRPFGACVPDLGKVLAAVLRVGLLVHSRHLPGYAVDGWAIRDLMESWGPVPPSVERAAVWLRQRDQAVRAASK